EHPFRVLPGEEVHELVGADQEQRLAPVARPEHVHRALVRIGFDFVVGEAGLRKLQPRPGVELYLLVAGPFGNEHDQVVEAEMLLSCTRQREVTVVRRVERTAEQARHWTSRISPSTSTSSPLRAPAASSAAASSSWSEGTSP